MNKTSQEGKRYKPNPTIERAIAKEDEAIGNLKSKFIRPDIRSQRRVNMNPGEVAGNIALAYHRGAAVGTDDTIKAILQSLKKFPEAQAHIKKHFKLLYS